MLRTLLFLTVALSLGCKASAPAPQRRAIELDPAAVCLARTYDLDPAFCLIAGSIHVCDDERCFRLTTVTQPIVQFPLHLTPTEKL